MITVIYKVIWPHSNLGCCSKGEQRTRGCHVGRCPAVKLLLIRRGIWCVTAQAAERAAVLETSAACSAACSAVTAKAGKSRSVAHASRWTCSRQQSRGIWRVTAQAAERAAVPEASEACSALRLSALSEFLRGEAALFWRLQIEWVPGRMVRRMK